MLMSAPCIAARIETVALDLERPKTEWTVTLTADTDTSIRATLRAAGSDFDPDGWTGLLFYGDSGGGITLTNTATEFGSMMWDITSPNVPTNGTYLVQVLGAKDKRLEEWGRGRMTVRASPSKDSLPTNWATNNLAYALAAEARDRAGEAYKKAEQALAEAEGKIDTEADPVALPVAAAASNLAANAWTLANGKMDKPPANVDYTIPAVAPDGSSTFFEYSAFEYPAGNADSRFLASVGYTRWMIDGEVGKINLAKVLAVGNDAGGRDISNAGTVTAAKVFLGEISSGGDLLIHAADGLKIQNLNAPVWDKDAANKGYVDNSVDTAKQMAGKAQDTADNAMTEAQAAHSLAKTKADAPVTELTSPDGTEKYTALGGVVTKSMAVPPEWRVLVNGNKLAEFPGIPPLPWNGQPQEGRYAASGVIPNWSIEIARGAGSGVIVSLYSFNATGSAYSARIEKDYWEFVSGSVPFVIYIGPQFPMGAEVVLFFNDLPPVNYPLMTQAQIDGLATKGYVDGLFADSADYNWKFIQGLGGTTISSASRMVYWPYTSPSSSTFQPWLYAPTVTYPKMDFRVWEGTGAHNVGKYFTIRCQLYADVIEKTTQTRMGKDLTLYLTPNGLKTTLPNQTADMFPSAGAVVEIQGVDIAAALLSALGYDPSLFEADIGSLAWAANMSSGTGAVNPRIQFRRHRE